MGGLIRALGESCARARSLAWRRRRWWAVVIGIVGLLVSVDVGRLDSCQSYRLRSSARNMNLEILIVAIDDAEGTFIRCREGWLNSSPADKDVGCVP